MSFQGVALTPNSVDHVSKSDTILQEFIVQVLSIKKVQVSQPNQPTRYRLVVSDGLKYMQAMVATQLNDLVDSNQVTRGSIIKVVKYVTNSIGAKQILIILSLTSLFQTADEIPRIGTPTAMEAPSQVTVKTEAKPSTTTPDQSYQPKVPVQSNNSINGYQNQFTTNQSVNQNSNSGMSAGPDPAIFMIKNLNPYQNKWTIKARVLSKGEVKSWSNAKGEGRLFSCVFADQSGEIRATTFKDGVTMFYDLLQENKVYYISKAALKTANRTYSTINNEYEMTLDPSTSITICDDCDDVPVVTYHAVELSMLEKLEVGTAIDVLGIVKDCSEVQEIMSKAQKPLTKRELTIVDMTGYAVRCTLWGKPAENFDYHDHPVIGVKGVKIGEFGGRSLSLGYSALLQVNPDIPAAHMLRGWYDQTGYTLDFKTYVGSAGSGGVIASTKTIVEVVEGGIGSSDKPEYFALEATIAHIKQENCWYPACPTEGCNKKVTEMNNEWRCEKCDQSYPAPNYRYILSFSVSDYTGQMWLQAFNESAEQILGKSANDLFVMRESNDYEFKKVFADALFKQISVKVKAKGETYQDELKIRYSVIGALPIDFPKRSLEIIELIDSFKKI